MLFAPPFMADEMYS